jgi:NAD(P)-dependent dehydrogenase (short-subunit alcohol dehydrogenase family)
MKSETQQKVAIVTGGGSGIGFAIAEKFVASNIQTVIVGRDQQKLDRAKQMLGKGLTTFCYDLNKLDSLPELVNRVIERFGRIDILVNNAGINLKKDLTEVTDEEFREILHLNVCAVFSLSREVSKKMIAAGSGSIINISSMAAQYGLPKVIAYTASKAAIDGMTRGMAVELSPLGVRVNCIAPGFIATDMSAKALNGDTERLQKVLSRTPLGKLGDAADIGEAALFLASDAAKYLTGVVLPVDGGNSIGF